MKNLVKIIITIMIFSKITLGQESTTHLPWFAKNPDEAAEAMAEKLKKLNIELQSINDIEVFEYDKKGKKTKNVKSIKRILELPENKLVQIEYDTKNVIKSFAISSTNIIDIATFTNLFGTNTWATVIEEPEMVMKTTAGYFSKFSIFNEKRTSGLETKSYSLFVEKEVKENQLTQQNVSPFSIDSLTIYTNPEKVKVQITTLLEGLGQKYLITEAEEGINDSNNGDLAYYYKTVLFKEGLNVQIFRKPNNTLSEFTVSCKNPITFLKIKRAFILPTMEQTEKTDTYTIYKYKNLEIMERTKEKVLDIMVYPYENDIAGRLSNAPTLSFDQIMAIYEKYKGNLAEKEAYIAKTFLNKINLDWKDKTIMPDLKYNNKNDFNTFYFLSPNNKIVECTIASNLTPQWTAPFYAHSEDIYYINKLNEDYKKSNYSNFTPVFGKMEGSTQALVFRIHDPRKEEERRANEVKERQERQQRAEEKAASDARMQALKYERAQRNLNTLNTILNQVQQQTIKK